MSGNSTIDFIARCAEVPSFTTYEERIIPLIEEAVSAVKNAELILIPENNVIIKVPGNVKKPFIALTAHLDKIDHFGKDYLRWLPVSVTSEKIIGQLDDAVGVGICLSMLDRSVWEDFPPLLILLSEVEEGNGLKNHPERLRKSGQGIHSGIGAERICDFLIANEMVPDQVITIDTTPLFKGESGLAIYTDHWEKNGLVPAPDLITATDAIYRRFQSIDTGLVKNNNTNDYLTYGLKFNNGGSKPVPSIALEPAIFPYHQQNEEVFLRDIDRLEKILMGYLSGVKM